MHRQQIQMLKSKKEVCPLDAGEAKLLLSRSIAKGPRQHTSSLNESVFADQSKQLYKILAS